MDMDEVIYGLNSQTRRRILSLLTKKPMSAPDIYHMLGDNAPVYRQSVNKSLDILERTKLVKKYYDSDKKAIYFKIEKNTLKINLDNLTIE